MLSQDWPTLSISHKMAKGTAVSLSRALVSLTVTDSAVLVLNNYSGMLVFKMPSFLQH